MRHLFSFFRAMTTKYIINMVASTKKILLFTNLEAWNVQYSCPRVASVGEGSRDPFGVFLLDIETTHCSIILPFFYMSVQIAPSNRMLLTLE